MAEKKKTHRSKKKDVLLPDVPDTELQPVSPQAFTEEKRRADRTVDQLIESLFGEKKKHGEVLTEQPPKQEAPRVPTPAEGGRVLVGSSDDDQVEELPLPEETVEPVLSLKEQMESSAADFRLLLDMEYEEELGNAIGFERIRTYHEKNMNGRRGSRRDEIRGEEFESQSQDAEVRRRYARERMNWMLRLGGTICFLVMILLYENTALMTRWFNGPVDASRYPVPYILLGLQLLLLDALLCFRPLWEGMKRLLRFSPVDYSVPAAMLLFTVFYHTVALFLPIRQYPVLLLSPMAFLITLLAAGRLLDLYREGLAFDVVSARRQKYAILPRVCVGGMQSSARARLARGEQDGNVWYLRSVGFVRNYFANTAARGSRHRNLGSYFLIVTATGTVFALFAYAGGAIASHVFAVFFSCVLLCGPVISSLLTTLPLFFSSCFCLRGRGAIIGETALDCCDGKDTLVLPDTDLFAAMEHAHFHLLDMCDAHRVTVLTHALLEKVQSPLSAAFGVDTTSRVSATELSLLHIGENGVSAQMRDESATVAIGTGEYMLERGFAFPATDQDQKRGTRRLFVAVDGCVCAVFAVRYTPAADLASLFAQLERFGVNIVVRSKDPCLYTELFAELFPQLLCGVTVQRPLVSELELRTDRVDSSLVSLGSCKELARTYVVCRRARRAGVLGKAFQVICATVGGALTALGVWKGYALSAGWITLWMLLWCGGYALFAYLYLRRPLDDI